MEKTRLLLKKIITWTLIGLGLIAVFRIGISISKSGKKPAELIYSVTTEKLVKQPIPHYLAMQGIVEGDPQVKAYPQVPGKFSRNAVAEGAMVTKGQDIVYIDRDMVGYQFQLAPVKAPAAGIVTRLYYIDKGDSVNPSMPVAEIANEEAVKVVFNVGQDELIQLEKGQAARISFIENPAITAEGEVYSVPPVINSEIMAGTIVVKARNNGKKMKLGMSVNVDIMTGTKENYMVSEKAVLMGGDRTYVYINISNTAKQVKVVTGYRSNDKIEIESPSLKEGDEIVTDGTFKLAEGVKIDAAPPATGEKKEEQKDFFKKIFGNK